MDKKYKKIESVIDEIESVDVDGITEVAEELQTPTSVRVVTITDANVRTFPNHKSFRARKISIGNKLEVVDIVEGVLVQNSNIWYQIADGYVHSSQVKEI